VVEASSDDYEVKCIFCGKPLDRSEMVRYRGAISCKDCADKQKSDQIPNLQVYNYFAALGCLVGIFSFIYFSFHVQLYSLIYQVSYIQPLLPFFSGLLVTVSLISLGLYAINRVQLFAASVVGLLMGILAAATSAFSIFDLVTNGPYYIVETTTYIKTIDYYPMILVTYSLFAITVALAILLHMANTRTEYTSIASAALFLLSSAIVMPILSWIVVGTLNALAFAVAFAFFLTRRPMYEEAPIQPV